MRKLAAILVLGAAMGVSLVATTAAAGQAPACPGQSTYLPNQASATAAAAITGALAGLGAIGSDGTVSVTFPSTVCGGFRLVVRGKEIRPGNPGYPRKDGYTTLANVLVVIGTGTVKVNFTLTQRGLDLLNFAKSQGTPLTTFVIAHIRPAGVSTSTEALQITTIT